MRNKKSKAVRKLIEKDESSKVPDYSPLKQKFPRLYTSFVRRRSVMVRKLLTDKPETAVAIMKHVWDQEYKHPEKKVLMNKYWRRNSNLAQLMLDMGKHKARKDDVKLLQTVNQVKQKYNSLRQACRLAEISWTKFHRHTYIKSGQKESKKYTRKLSQVEINHIHEHFQSENISFPLPDKKYHGKRFMRYSLKKSCNMYNMCSSTTRKISIATYHRHKPKAVKLQGRIPFMQSCCERCQNFENILHEASMHLKGIPRDVGDCIDRSLCGYSNFFPKISCILRTCNECGTEFYKDSIVAQNAEKMKDKHKRFMVKLWITKTVKKEGVTQSFLDWKFERCNYEELVDLLMQHLYNMSEHTFMASWNYCQYKQAKKNIEIGDVILVHDFAQNYLCKHQKEVQGLHWRHEQVTIMPTVAHYKCAKCHQITTNEIVHISEDLKHDAHLVKAFTSRSLAVLNGNKVPIQKIIEFTDQAPSQYKNKTVFHHLANNKVPTQKIFFGVRHGKSSCDACTGRVKQGVTRLVQTEQEVVNSAQTFYEACIKHLQKPLTQSQDACQHYILTFEYHNKLVKRPSTISLTPIPGTRKIHQIGNTGGKELYYRKFACFCYGCLHGTEGCSNNICPSEWSGFDLATKKNVKPNLKFWFGDNIRNFGIHNLSQRDEVKPRAQPLNWSAILRALSQQRTFVQLQRYVFNNPIPDLICGPNDSILQSEMNTLDLVALHHMPNDMPRGYAPLQIEGDGNCFPRTISYLLYKTQDRYEEMRCRIVYEAVKNINHYLDHDYVSNGAHNLYDRGTLPEQYAQYSDNYNPHQAFNLTRLYKREVLDICCDGAYMGIWQIFQIANVIKMPITSVHPMIGNANVRADMHRTVYCIDDAHNQQRPINLMWTPMQVNGGRPCHFVPLVKV